MVAVGGVVVGGVVRLGVSVVGEGFPYLDLLSVNRFMDVLGGVCFDLWFDVVGGGVGRVCLVFGGHRVAVVCLLDGVLCSFGGSPAVLEFSLVSRLWVRAGWFEGGVLCRGGGLPASVEVLSSVGGVASFVELVFAVVGDGGVGVRSFLGGPGEILVGDVVGGFRVVDV